MTDKKETHYEVFVDSTYQSDVLNFNNEEEAIDEAKKWADEIDHRSPVVVVKVEQELIFSTERR